MIWISGKLRGLMSKQLLQPNSTSALLTDITVCLHLNCFNMWRPSVWFQWPVKQNVPVHRDWQLAGGNIYIEHSILQINVDPQFLFAWFSALHLLLPVLEEEWGAPEFVILPRWTNVWTLFAIHQWSPGPHRLQTEASVWKFSVNKPYDLGLLEHGYGAPPDYKLNSHACYKQTHKQALLTDASRSTQLLISVNLIDSRKFCRAFTDHSN